MKRTKILCMMAFATLAVAAQDTFVTWETLGNEKESYTQRFVVKGDMTFDKIGFNMTPRRMTVANPQDTLTELMPGYYTLTSPRFHQGADSVVVDLVTASTFGSISFAPDGLHRINRDGSTKAINYNRKPVTQPKQWLSPKGNDRMPYGDYFYDINAKISKGKVGAYDVLPSYKSVVLTGGMSKLPLKRGVKIVKSDIPEYYQITVKNDSVVVAAADERTAEMAMKSFDAQVLSSGDKQLPNAVITDYPDYGYRGLMIDVSRNFQTPETLKKVIDEMAKYRLNILHLHFIDDEGWRIEIPALPELTEFGGRRGYSTDESEYLFQIYCGDGNPNSREGVSNGFYTRNEFIDLIKYAYDKGISVIPEVESPGHARAAVKAMEKRYRDTGDDTYRLIHDGDTSEYTTAQNYHDNVMNPALEGPYKFMEVVFDAIIDMYAEAGVPLLSIHIGGDEVAKGSWDGSEPAQNLIKEKNLNGQTGLHGYFVEKIAEILKSKNVPMSGWQEIALGHTDAYNQSMAPLTYGVNCWTLSSPDPDKSVTARGVKAGFPIIISNVDHFYLDMCYNRHPNEPGYTWGGVVDEFQSLHGYPSLLCPIDDKDEKGKIIGLSAHIWGETLRSPEMLEMYLYPKMLGFVERSWNADSTYTDADFNAVIAEREMPRWDKEGTNYHLRQPGIKHIGSKIYMNSPYEGAEIRYTTDGTEPTAQSRLYTSPISAKGIKEVRARLFHRGKQSLTSLLYTQK